MIVAMFATTMNPTMKTLKTTMTTVQDGGSVRDGICVDPPLFRGTSQGKYGS